VNQCFSGSNALKKSAVQFEAAVFKSIFNTL